jgi:putative PIG3 family NAD(P)H quinone oxidoreductase
LAERGFSAILRPPAGAGNPVAPFLREIRMTIPERMMAIDGASFGGPEVLRLVEMPTPKPGPDEVLVRVAAAGVNRPDVLQRKGHYPPPPGASAVPGLEIAGEVVARGERVKDLGIGNTVCALVAGGGYAQYCTVPSVQCLPWPKGFDAVQAAALPETFFTVWHNVFERGRLVAGETLLVHGGSSGIGTTAIQLARAFGARVLATVGSAEKAKACEALGAERAIRYKDEDFAEVVKAVTGGQGVDVILDMVAGDYTGRNIASLAVEGRLVIIAFQRGNKVELDVNPVMRRRLTITGSALRARPAEEKGAIGASLRLHVWPKLDQGQIRPIIHATFPLAAAAEAHRLMESSAHIGKIVLVAE